MLTAPLGDPKFAGNGRSLDFIDHLPEAGQTTYGADLSFYSGRARSSRVSRPIQLGTARVVVTDAQKVIVHIPLNPRARRALRRHPRARLVVRTYFVAADDGHHLNTARTIPRGHQPRR